MAESLRTLGRQRGSELRTSSAPSPDRPRLRTPVPAGSLVDRWWTAGGPLVDHRRRALDLRPPRTYTSAHDTSVTDISCARTHVHTRHAPMKTQQSLAPLTPAVFYI